jgi:hypothetical protein
MSAAGDARPAARGPRDFGPGRPDHDPDDDVRAAPPGSGRDTNAAPADPVHAYLREIGRTPLLSAAEEVDLAKRIEVGLYAAERIRIATEATDDAVTADDTAARSGTAVA